MNYTVYVPADSIWPLQYPGIESLQVDICIYSKKQFEKTNCTATHVYVTTAMTSLPSCSDAPFEYIRLRFN